MNNCASYESVKSALSIPIQEALRTFKSNINIDQIHEKYGNNFCELTGIEKDKIWGMDEEEFVNRSSVAHYIGLSEPPVSSQGDDKVFETVTRLSACFLIMNDEYRTETH